MFTWMLRRAKLMLFVYLTDMITPLFLVGVLAVYAIQLFAGTLSSSMPFSDNIFLMIFFGLLGAAVSVGIRQLYVMRFQLSSLLYLPLFVVIMTFIMVPVRIIGLARCADDLGWGTRKAAYAGNDDAKTDVAAQEAVL